MLITATLLALSLHVVPVLQDPRPVGDPMVQDAPTRLEDVVVDGRRLETMTRDFVEEIAAPARNRGVARWRRPVCVGVVNLQRDVAEYIADRVSTVAADLGLRVASPGCEPTILIVAAADGAEMAKAMVESRPRQFIVGGSGMDRGRRALEAFNASDAPVRWWHVSAPVDSDTGSIAVRLPGAWTPGSGGINDSSVDYAPRIAVRSASRLNTQIRDDILKTYVIVDVNRLGDVRLGGLGDYLAFVALAQVDPSARPDRYDTVLNLFERPDEVQGLTSWDEAYLFGLYDTNTSRSDRRAQVQSVADSILQKYRGLRAEEATEE